MAITLGGVLLLVGGTGTGIVMAQQSSGGQSALQDQAVISEAEASAIAQNAYPDTTVKDVELEKEHGLLIYDVELDNGLELAVNAADGSIVSTEQDDDWQAWDDNDEVLVAPGQIDDGAELLSQASITLDQAITAAQQAQDGPLGEIDLEKYQGKLVFNVEIGQYDVKVDASNASILGVDQDD